MEKTNSEPLQEAKTTAAADQGEKQKAAEKSSGLDRVLNFLAGVAGAFTGIMAGIKDSFFPRKNSKD